MNVLALFASCPKGVEPLLVTELAALGAQQTKERPGGVSFNGDLAVAYRICLWSRLASRLLMPLQTFPALDADALSTAARAQDWSAIFNVSCKFAIEVAGRSKNITHTHYAALKVKDGIADYFRDTVGKRPDVDTERPDIRIHLHLQPEQATLSLDLSGDSLHRRGYRKDGGPAPLKENLAAAILARSGWAEIAARGGTLMDPMCGSGTLLIEGALMAADIAPGLHRGRHGFSAWKQHQPSIWNELIADATARAKAGVAKLPPMFGQDLDSRALAAARDNAKRAGLGEHIQWSLADATSTKAPPTSPGLLVTNPPYGERLGEEAELIKLYSLFGATLKNNFGGWRAVVFTGRPDLGPRMGLRADALHSLYNGPLPCKLLRFEIAAPSVGSEAKPRGGSDFANRLDKAVAHLGKWAKRKGVNAYRLYDGDLPDYAVAVDLYEGKERHVHVQEYAAPKTIDPFKAEKRLREALAIIQEHLDIPSAQLHFKIRKQQRGDAQYRKQNELGRMHEIVEHGCKLWVNFDDYLDTGVFLDHRPLRLRIQQEAAGKRFLNLFCYTASASVHAARGGAKQTLSLDMSNTYLEWGQKNLYLNDIRAELFERPPTWAPPAHALVRVDCIEWLKQQAALASPKPFDLILLDPPTFSNSKKMTDILDIQRDHVTLIQQTATLLAPGGTLYFSTNRRGFKFDTAALTGLEARDITAQTVDEDFKRPPPPHKCWKITRTTA